jgi:hypothetical protein
LHELGDALLELPDDVALVVDPYAGDGVAMAAFSQRCDLALDDMRVCGEAEVIVAPQLEVAGTRRAALQRVPALPEIYFAADVVIVDACTDKVWLLRAINLGLTIRRPLIRNPEQHWQPH